MALRPSEAAAMRVSWFSVQTDKVIMTVQAGNGFVPKNARNRSIPISHDLFERLNGLRLKIIEQNPKLAESPYFIAAPETKRTRKLANQFKAVNGWLRLKGITERLPLYSLRKMGGSLIMKNSSLLEASRILGHSNVNITAKHYAGIIEPKTLNGIDTAPQDAFAAVAKSLGISVEELRAKLA